MCIRDRTMTGLWFSSLPAPIVIVISLICAVVVGGFYAWIPAILKVKLGVSEVITTIMLNTVAIQMCIRDRYGAGQRVLPGLREKSGSDPPFQRIGRGEYPSHHRSHVQGFWQDHGESSENQRRIRGRNPFDERCFVMIAIVDYGVGNIFSLYSLSLIHI